MCSQLKPVALAALMIILLFVPQEAAGASSSDTAIRQMLANRILTIAATGGGVGIVVGLVDSSRRTIISVGQANSRDGRPLTGDTVFEVGSVGKVFTAVLLSEMVQRGELALADPVEKYMPPGIRLPEYNGRAMSLADLATHTSGLPFMPDRYPVVGGTATYGPRDLYDFLARYRLRRSPGAEWEYSNLDYWLLGQALAHRAGMPVDALLRTRVFEPLHMLSTATELRGALKLKLATGHDASLHRAPPFYGLSIYRTLGAAAGGVYSSANDLLTFVAAAIGLERSPLTTSLNAMLDTRRPIDGTQQALGWTVEGRAGDQYMFHDGGTWGYASAVAWDPIKRVGVVVLSNQQDSVADIARHLLRPGLPLEIPAPYTHAEVHLARSALVACAGQYKADEVGMFAIVRDHDHLILEVPVDWGLPRFRLHAESAREFFVAEMPMHVTFRRDAKGSVTGAVFYPPRGQRGIAAVKINPSD